MAQLSTFQNEGRAKQVLVMESVADVQQFVRHQTGPFFVLGKGSNTVINPDSRIQTYVQISPDITPISHVGTILTASAGARVNQLTKYCAQNGLAGFEFAAGVPASLGGMVTMNFGCWGREICDFLISVDVVTEHAEFITVPVNELRMSYRSSRVMSEKWIVISATLQMSTAPITEVQQKIDDAIQTRLAKQPLRDRTFGSTFKNPPNDFAARLIEACGLKGFECEGVQISDKHANFLVNTGGATFQSLHNMLTLIERKVDQQFGIKLEREIRLVE